MKTICLNNMATVFRVSYGRNDTPEDLREYKLKKLGINSPVGTLSDWKCWAESEGYNGLKVIEKDNSVSYKPFKTAEDERDRLTELAMEAREENRFENTDIEATDAQLGSQYYSGGL